MIQEEENGIEFKFCLLNEADEAATVFSEGKNFSFYFSITNKRNERLYFNPDFAFSKENNFCWVYNSTNQKIGKLFIFQGYDKICVGAYPFDTGETYVFEQHWIDNRDSIWCWKYGYYESTNQEPLTKGNYYTGLNTALGLHIPMKSLLFILIL